MLLECIICILTHPSITCVSMLLNKKSAPELMCVCVTIHSLMCLYEDVTKWE